MPTRPAPRSPEAALIFLSVAWGLATGIAGCSIPPEEQGFSSASPVARVRAVGVAVADDDTAAIPNLITMLGSDDPAQRMLAIRALEQMTGQTLGYAHDAPEASRQKAIAAWVDWWNASQPGPGEPPPVAPTAAMTDHQGAEATPGARPPDPSR